MLLSHLPAFLATAFDDMASSLHKHSAARLPLILTGILLASGRRTVTSWFRPVEITDQFRCAYNTVHATGCHTQQIAQPVFSAVAPLLDPKRLCLAIDDSPTPRYGPMVEGAGIHHNPTPGPAGEKYLYGHVWVVLSALANHQHWGIVSLPLQGQLYVRKTDLPKLPPERPRQFRTKLEMALDQLIWAKEQANGQFEELWAVTDGGYAKKVFIKGAKALGFTLVSRLRKDAALRSLPEPVKPGQKRGRGRPPIYGKKRISLAKRAGQTRGWQEVECVQYGKKVTKTIKTFLATYRPAGGVIRVVLVKEEDEWLPFFSTNPEATVVEILESMANRGSHEQMNKDIKEVWGAGQQQVRNIDSNEGCFNLNLWMHSLTEAWAWQLPDEELVNRSDSPWDDKPRRPSHADKRKALQLEVLRREIEEALKGRPNKQEIRDLLERILALAV